MLTSKEYIESGILELYVLGITSAEETVDVEIRAALDTLIQQEINAISASMESYAMAQAVEPSSLVKAFLLSTVDYTERLKKGEPMTFPPLLSENSIIADYTEWLDRMDMKYGGKEDLFAKIIGFTPAATTAIVWVKDYAPHEVHDDVHERFLVVEGSCEIIIDEHINELGAGDYFAIPLHKIHLVKVTSSIPCKVILQRVAA